MASRGDIAQGDNVTAWSVSKAAVDRWMATAKPGDQLVYASGRSVIPSSGVTELRELYDAGSITFTTKRNGPGDTSFIAQRLHGDRRPAPQQRIGARASDDADEIAMLMATLRRKAAGKQPCPTNRELGAEIGEQLGCAAIAPERVSYLLRKQISAKRISVEAGARGRRVVTLLSTGLRTAAL